MASASSQTRGARKHDNQNQVNDDLSQTILLNSVLGHAPINELHVDNPLSTFSGKRDRLKASS